VSDKLPPGWVWGTIGDVAIVNPTTRKASIPDDLNVSFVPMAAVTEVSGRINLSEARPARVLKLKGYRSFVDGDVLVAKITPSMENGKAAVARGLENSIGFGSTEFHVLRPLETTSAKYLFHYVVREPFRAKAARAMTGTAGQLRVPPDFLRTAPIPIAPPAEQERIVAAIDEHFSRLDAAEAMLAAARRKLSSLRRSAVARLFDHADWPWTTLGEIAEIKGGVTKDSKRQSDPGYVEVPYLRVANVQRGYLDLSEVSRIRIRPAKAAQLALRTGDVLFNEGGDRDKLGRGWVWDGQIDNCIHQNHVFRARLSSGEFDPYFVSVHGNTWGQRWFETHGKHTTNLATLNLTTLKSFPVPAPPLAEQREVVAEFQSIRGSEDRLRTEFSRAESRSASLRRSILAAAFSGRLVPQDPDDEPASVLLERIAASRPAKPARRRMRT